MKKYGDHWYKSNDFVVNPMDKFVDYFVICESTKTHQGKNKKLNFDSYKN